MGDTSFRPSDASTYDQDLSKDYAAELENEMTKGAPRPRDVQADVKEMMKTFEKDKHNEFEKMIKGGSSLAWALPLTSMKKIQAWWTE